MEIEPIQIVHVISRPETKCEQHLDRKTKATEAISLLIDLDLKPKTEAKQPTYLELMYALACLRTSFISLKSYLDWSLLRILIAARSSSNFCSCTPLEIYDGYAATYSFLRVFTIY